MTSISMIEWNREKTRYIYIFYEQICMVEAYKGTCFWCDHIINWNHASSISISSCKMEKSGLIAFYEAECGCTQLKDMRWWKGKKQSIPNHQGKKGSDTIRISRLLHFFFFWRDKSVHFLSLLKPQAWCMRWRSRLSLISSGFGNKFLVRQLDDNNGWLHTIFLS